MIEMVVDSLRASMMGYQRVVILKERDAERYLPIWIGPAEADAIALKLQDVAAPRPLTHDLLCSIITTLGAKVNSIVVNELHNDTFYAKLMLNANEVELEIDSRPSDAIAIAVRTRVPIYAEESVLDKAGIIMDQETGRPIPANSANRKGHISEEELRRMSAFTDFINGLDLKDFDKGKP